MVNEDTRSNEEFERDMAALDKAHEAGWIAAGEAHAKEQAEQEPDPEPPVEEKARFIAENDGDYPAHWADEVAQAYLELHGQLPDLEALQQQFEAKLTDITAEREGKQLLQVALPILTKFIESMVHEGYRNSVMAEADRRGLECAEVVINDALDYARGLMVGCGLKVRG